MKKQFYTVATFLAFKGLTNEAFEAMEANKRAEILSEQAKANDEYFKELEGSIESKVSKEELDSMQTKQAEIIKEIERLSMEAKAQAEKVAKGGNENVLAKELKENSESLKSIVKGNGQELVVKATTNRASITGNTHSIQLTTIGQLGVKARSLYDKIRKVTVGKGNHNGTITYQDWDEATTVRAAAMVAEGAAFPESTAKWQEYSLKVRKIGDTLPVTEEFFEDEERAAAELEMFLDTNVNSKIDDQIVNGDGTGENLKGLLASVPAFTAVASGIPSANIYDLVKKVRTDITKTRGSKYRPDMVVFNSDTLDRLQLEKDANDSYIFRDVMNIGAMEIVIDDNLADNVMVVGDSRFASIYEMGGVVLSKGEINAQFTSDMMTIKARKRLLFLIRNVDQTGFRKVTNITSALATLATP